MSFKDELDLRISQAWRHGFMTGFGSLAIGEVLGLWLWAML